MLCCHLLCLIVALLPDGRILQRYASTAEGACRRCPQAIREMRDRFQGDTFFGGEARSGRAEDQKRRNCDGPGAASMEIRVSCADRGARIDDVVHDDNALAADPAAKRVGNTVLH